MNYRRAFSTLGCGELSLAEVLALAVRQQVPAVELRALGGSLDLAAALEREAGTPAELAGRVQASGVGVVAIDTSLHVIGAGAAERAEFLKLLPWAEALGGVWLRVFDGGESGDASELEEAAELLLWWQELKHQRGWRSDVMIETHDALVTTERLQAFLAEAPAGTAILWDAHHTWKKGGERPLDTWRALSGRIVHVHVKDSVSRPSARHPFTYVAPGAGEFPMAELRDALVADKFAGALSLEWERWWHPYLEPLEPALAAATRDGWW